jgi:hypothetical protein
MSQLLSNTNSFPDQRIQPPDYISTGVEQLIHLSIDQIPDMLWPRSHQFGATPLLNPDPYAQSWEVNVLSTGSRHRKVFTGVTLNASGAPLGGCTVQLFNTATGAIVDTQVSDSAGNYKVSDPNNVACFLVAYLPGSPDVAGTTIDELTGT